jgi:hypothetical protein
MPVIGEPHGRSFLARDFFVHRSPGAGSDLRQNPDRAPVVSTQHGREEAMTLVHDVATSADHAVAPAVEGFAAEIAAVDGDEPIPAHQATKIIGEVMAQLD